jgi:F0F1-type ATP synthase membrane subunit b/b'
LSCFSTTAFADGHFDQAHATANQALAEARKNAKKIAELAQEGLANLKEHAPKASKAPERRKARA